MDRLFLFSGRENCKVLIFLLQMAKALRCNKQQDINEFRISVCKTFSRLTLNWQIRVPRFV